MVDDDNKYYLHLCTFNTQISNDVILFSLQCNISKLSGKLSNDVS
jgi:hypothetical protein